MKSRGGRTRVGITRGFEGDVARIQDFLEQVGAPGRVNAFLEDLERRVIPLLRQTPQLGAPLRTDALPPEGQLLFARLRQRLQGREARTLVRSDFVLLYVVGDDGVWLVSVRHQREAGFRFGGP
jgi:ParE toxin of type II toxin-antitoxin system, parDE